MAFFEIFRQPPEKHLFVQSRINTLKTFTSITGLFNNTSKENKRLTASFLGKNCLELNGYLSLLYSKELFPLTQLSVDSYKGDKRKATGDPYYKHIFYTGYLFYELLKTLKYDKKYRQIFIAAAQLHDVIEMRNKINPTYDRNDLLHQMTDIGIEQSDAEKILTIDSLLTPEPKETDMDTQSWIERKNADFDYIMQINGEQVNERYVDLFSKNSLSGGEANQLAEMVRQIKIADDAAILREIVDDITCGRDDKNKEKNGIRPLRERFVAYNYRAERIHILFINHPLLKQMQGDLDIIQGYLQSK